jgi:hypothetical protein
MLKDSVANPSATCSTSEISELELQANYLTESLSSLAVSLDHLNSRLKPVLKSCPVSSLAESVMQEPNSSLGTFVNKATLDINRANQRISEILQTLAV